jgi:uncharacterized protein YjiS (DUF1127 family)
MDGVEENAKALSLARINTSERLLRRLVVEAVRRLVRSFLDRGRWRRDRRHLAALDERALRDLGIARDEIASDDDASSPWGSFR